MAHLFLPLAAHPRRARPGDWRQGGPRRRPARRQREGGLASRGRARLATAPSWAAAGPSSRKRAALPPVGSSSSAAAAAACLPSRPSTTPAASGTSALPLRLQVTKILPFLHNLGFGFNSSYSFSGCQNLKKVINVHWSRINHLNVMGASALCISLPFSSLTTVCEVRTPPLVLGSKSKVHWGP